MLEFDECVSVCAQKKKPKYQESATERHLKSATICGTCRGDLFCSCSTRYSCCCCCWPYDPRRTLALTPVQFHARRAERRKWRRRRHASAICLCWTWRHFAASENVCDAFNPVFFGARNERCLCFQQQQQQQQQESCTTTTTSESTTSAPASLFFGFFSAQC